MVRRAPMEDRPGPNHGRGQERGGAGGEGRNRSAPSGSGQPQEAPAGLRTLTDAYMAFQTARSTRGPEAGQEALAEGRGPSSTPLPPRPGPSRGGEGDGGGDASGDKGEALRRRAGAGPGGVTGGTGERSGDEGQGDVEGQGGRGGARDGEEGSGGERGGDSDSPGNTDGERASGRQQRGKGSKGGPQNWRHSFRGVRQRTWYVTRPSSPSRPSREGARSMLPRPRQLLISLRPKKAEAIDAPQDGGPSGWRLNSVELLGLQVPLLRGLGLEASQDEG